MCEFRIDFVICLGQTKNVENSTPCGRLCKFWIMLTGRKIIIIRGIWCEICHRCPSARVQTSFMETGKMHTEPNATTFQMGFSTWWSVDAWESLRSLDIALNDEKHTEKLLIHLSVWFVGPALCWIRIKNALEWECVCQKWTKFDEKWTKSLWKIFELLSRHELNVFKMLWTKNRSPKFISAKDKNHYENVRDCKFLEASKMLMNASRVREEWERVKSTIEN